MVAILSLSFALFSVSCKSANDGNDNPGTEQPDDPDNPGGGTDEPDDPDNPDKPGGETDEPETPPVAEVLEITGPADGVYGYTKKLRNYLTAEGDDVKVSDYVNGGREDEAYDKISVTWKSTYSDVEKYKIFYGTKPDFSDAIETEMSATARKLNVYNLYKDTTYYVKVTAVRSAGDVSATYSFKTTDVGPRVMKIGNIGNARDLGGYKTESGKTTLQGKIFRGGQLTPNANYSVYDAYVLNDSGKKFMSETLGIKTDFDLRNASENKGLTQSAIPGANLEYYSVGGYLSAFTDKAGYRRVFSALSEETRYPLYIHCTGGADRTGTVCFLINALLGVDEKTLIQDYETTSFSTYEMRNKESTTYQFTPFLNQLKSDYAGDTLSKKTENYLLSIGVTKTEIYNIKAIMFGEETKKQENITLNSDNLAYTCEDAVGYDGNVVTADIKRLVDDRAGGTYFFIGSYGFYYRGGLFRLSKIENGEYKEISPRVSLGEYGREKFNAGVKLGMSVTVKDSSTVILKAFIDGTELFSYEVARVNDEISGSNVKFTVKITAMVSELVMTKE